jgi:rubrerythrin
MTQEDFERAIKVLQKHNQDLIAEIQRLKQKPKTGHWKRISMDRYTTHAQYWYECDKCGEHNLGNTNFCPNCGAKMRKESE